MHNKYKEIIKIIPYKRECIINEIDIITPYGIPLRIGQRWQEVDSRFTRYVTVLDFSILTNKVQIQHGRKTWAKLERFNGKSHGYIPV